MIGNLVLVCRNLEVLAHNLCLGDNSFYNGRVKVDLQV